MTKKDNDNSLALKGAMTPAKEKASGHEFLDDSISVYPFITIDKNSGELEVSTKQGKTYNSLDVILLGYIRELNWLNKYKKSVKQYRALVFIKELKLIALVAFPSFFKYIVFSKYLKGQFASNGDPCYSAVTQLSTEKQTSADGINFYVYTFKRKEDLSPKEFKMIENEKKKTFEALQTTSYGVFIYNNEDVPEIEKQLASGAKAQNGKLIPNTQSANNDSRNDSFELNDIPFDS